MKYFPISQFSILSSCYRPGPDPPSPSLNISPSIRLLSPSFPPYFQSAYLTFMILTFLPLPSQYYSLSFSCFLTTVLFLSSSFLHNPMPSLSHASHYSHPLSMFLFPSQSHSLSSSFFSLLSSPFFPSLIHSLSHASHYSHPLSIFFLPYLSHSLSFFCSSLVLSSFSIPLSFPVLSPLFSILLITHIQLTSYFSFLLSWRQRGRQRETQREKQI